ISSRLSCSAVATAPRPALLTSTSMRPRSARTPSTQARAASWSVTSSGRTSSSTPTSRAASVRAVARATSRIVATTARPRRASSTAVCSPMPEEVPVTSATRLSIWLMRRRYARRVSGVDVVESGDDDLEEARELVALTGGQSAQRVALDDVRLAHRGLEQAPAVGGQRDEGARAVRLVGSALQQAAAGHLVEPVRHRRRRDVGEVGELAGGQARVAGACQRREHRPLALGEVEVGELPRVPLVELLRDGR